MCIPAELIAEFGLPVVHAYMRHIQENAELAVREMLQELSATRKVRHCVARDRPVSTWVGRHMSAHMTFVA